MKNPKPSKRKAGRLFAPVILLGRQLHILVWKFSLEHIKKIHRVEANAIERAACMRVNLLELVFGVCYLLCHPERNINKSGCCIRLAANAGNCGLV